MTKELLRSGHLVNVQMWSKDQTIFTQKANFNRGQNKSGLQETELLLSNELII